MIRINSKKILEEQLQLLSEMSKNKDVNTICSISHSMCEVAQTINVLDSLQNLQNNLAPLTMQVEGILAKNNISH